MAWLDITFPPRLSFGIECDPEWSTTVASLASGFEQRNQDWLNARHNYDASFAIRTAEDHKLIRTHFHMARGKLHSWPLLDPLDSDATVTDGIAKDTTTEALQLYKRYGTGTYAYDRKITRPFGVSVYFSGVLKTVDVDYTLDLTTGLLQPTDTDTVAADVTWAGSFYVPCRYDVTKLPVKIVSRNGTDFLVSSDDIPIVEVRE